MFASVLLVPAAGAHAATMFYIRGGGDGHGIGMSQYGSYGYALHGKHYRWILAHYYQGTQLGHTNPNQIVRVLLSTGSATFSGATRAANKQLRAGRTYSVSANADGTVSLRNQAGKRIGTFAAPLTVSGSGPLDLAGAGTYRGSLEFRPDGSGGVETVEAVGLDDYVRGVISAEMPANWSPQALDVQAIAARTYAITTDVAGQDFDLYPDTRSQMYRGVAAETTSTDAAVADTRGQVVTYAGRPVVTYFFNSSGGHTENIENVWPGARPEPWLKGVPDPYDGAGGDPYHRWGSQESMANASAALKPYLKGRLVGVRITRTGSSPRVLTAEVVGTRGRVAVTGIQLQHAFGLLTTYADFTTITTLAGGAPAVASRRASGPARSQAVAALVPLVRNLISTSVAGLHGSVFPGVAGSRVEIELHVGGRWKTVARMSTDGAGAYDAALPGKGTYRVVYHGLDGPAIRVN